MEKRSKKIVILIIVIAVALVALGFVIGTLRSQSSENNTADYIGMGRAKAIALKDSGVSESDSDFTEEKLKKDDRLSVYDLEFNTSEREYSYEINAKNGEIIEKDSEKAEIHVDHEDSDLDDEHESDDHHGSSSSDSGSEKRISLAKAKNIALKDAGLSKSDVTFTKQKSDREDGIPVYEIEFIYSGTEYEYEINAETGKITESSSESH